MFRNFLIVKQINSTVVRLPAPMNISFFWNFGSCLGFLLVMQILTGLFLSMMYISESKYTFQNMNYMMMDNNFGWVLRLMHTIGASFLMLVLYLHLLRGFYYKRFVNKGAWNIGVILMILMMGTAFLGYVLPWGQMSFWGATVITNLITTIPFIGDSIVSWLWGGFSVSGYTLTRFFSFHFILPFSIILFSLFHLLMIHNLGAGNTLGTSSNLKIDFWPFFGYKDVLGFFFLFFFYFFFIFFLPYNLMDPENFMMANPGVTPLHIKPEWYFLFAYAMLRSIPNKVLGVLVLVFSILVFFLLPYGNKNLKMNFFFIYKLVFFFWVFNFILLTWLGGCPVKIYYNFLSQISGILYFFLIFLMLYL
uniref:Cytochrome b n=1 Tax=Didemnum vexillum TaxID=516032 RepID=A0A0A7LFA1_9ASCI|nr:cytochrome b [Didemnum vexillum]AIZ58122.1 cytochrome b [Didemnum vexillum]UYK51626.1 cytochrome b [Didemnum vexillum]